MSPEDRVHAAVRELADALLAAARESRPPVPSAPIELLSPAAFARRASLSRSSLYLALAKGDIRSLKVRGRRLIPASEISRLTDAAT